MMALVWRRLVVPVAACLSLAWLVALSACAADHLPEQDMRILQATPVAKMPVEDLWKEYTADAASAGQRYKGRAVDITGRVSRVGDNGEGHSYLLFVQDDPFGVRANLLDDQAAAIVAAAPAGTRITLRCFCEGLDGHLILKSCVRP
jgi:hypothetical protein